MRFRNHISIIAERMGSAFVVLFILLINALRDIGEEITEDSEAYDIESGEVLLIAGGILLALIVLIVWQVIVWSKTYISIQDNTIVIEKNTINQKKNIIGIKNISNINTEQNLFERLIGTCKVKLDTNSLSTADKTDVKIVLKKADAQNFRQEILNLLYQTESGGEMAESQQIMEYDFAADMGDVVIHGLFSINLISVFVVIGCIAGAAETLSRTFENGVSGTSIFNILIQLLLVIFILSSALWDIAKGFIKYYDFKVKRSRDKIYLNYGLLKKVNYAIPVDKIHAVKLSQSMIARIAGRYMAEIINVGMGDDGGEQRSFLVLYCKKEQMEQMLETLLPEFGGIFEQPVKRQPGSSWLAGLPGMFLFLVILAGCVMFGLEFMPEYFVYVLYGSIAVLVFALILAICRFYTAGSRLDSEHVILANGYFGRRITCIKCNEIQYIEAEQNFIARKFQIQKGMIFLLASSANKSQVIPYCKDVLIDQLKDNPYFRRG